MISKTRGDTIGLKFQRKDADGEIILTAPTAMYFTLKKPRHHTHVLLR